MDIYAIDSGGVVFYQCGFCKADFSTPESLATHLGPLARCPLSLDIEAACDRAWEANR